MTPQQKADRLCMDMLLQIECNCQPSICKMVAKQCALIAVDEMLEEIKDSADKEIVVLRIIYWEKVKQEIEKL
jgi:hypothetical protein